MPAFNPSVKQKIVKDKPCFMCGARHLVPDAAHIVDKGEWEKKLGSDRQVNGIPLCPNCHRIFEDQLRPRLYKALKEFGTRGLPQCWRSSNKGSRSNGSNTKQGSR